MLKFQKAPEAYAHKPMHMPGAAQNQELHQGFPETQGAFRALGLITYRVLGFEKPEDLKLQHLKPKMLSAVYGLGLIGFLEVRV